ncbi:group II intron maturase-specific domain-containing protein, partial [Paenibacillus popilliae]
FILITPRKKACVSVKARIREIIHNGGAKSAKKIVQQINVIFAGWVNYFRVGNSSDAFSEVRDYTEMKIRTLL